VTLHSKSHVEGDLSHQTLTIEKGAYFEGRSHRFDDPLWGEAASGDPPEAMPP
jgi:cytoskeletal protein CcmA (bactofilin family)